MCGIYKIENLINGKVYIGKSINIQHRFRAHKNDSFNPKSKSYNSAIYRAIRKYGIENFSFEVIEECKEEFLNERETFWIDYYQSFGNGYNLTPGGDGFSTINKSKVYELWDKGLAVTEIADILSHDRHSISRVLINYDNYKKEESKKRQYNIISNNKKNPVLQYSLDGNFVQKYDSALQASEITKINYRTIMSNLHKKSLSAGGFQWIFEEEEPPGKYMAKYSGDKKPVLQLNLQNEFIKEYPSIAEAKRAVGLIDNKSITICCNNPTRTAAGFYWRWKDDILD